MVAGLDQLWLEWMDAASALWVHGGRHLLQATLFSGLVFVVVVLLARGPARLRHSLCLVASLKFLVPSALLAGFAAWLDLDLGAAAAPLRGLLAGPVGEWVAWLLAGPARTSQTAVTGGPVVTVLVSVWLLGSTVLFVRWLRRHRVFARAVAAGRRHRRGREVEILERGRRRLGLRRRVVLVTSEALAEPGAWGILRPAVVLPEGVAAELDAAELEAVILHELVHIQRWDNLIATLQRVQCCLFWFHPLLWLLDRKLLVERERVCDEKVVALAGVAEPYARGLLKVLRFGVGLRPAGVSAATASNLKARIEHIQTGSRRHTWPWPLRTAPVAAGVLLFLAVSAMAQRPEPCKRGWDRHESAHKTVVHADRTPCARRARAG